MNTGLNKIREDINNIFILKDKEITDEVINYLNKTFFVMTDIMVLTNDAPCFKNDKFMLYILNQNINNIKYYNSNNPSEAIIDYLVNKNYVFKSCDNPILLNNRLLVDNVINMGDINDLFINDISLSQKQLDKIIEIIRLKNININYISNKYLVNNEEFLNELINLYKIKNPYLLSNYNVVSNIGRSLELGLNNIISRDGIEINTNDLGEGVSLEDVTIEQGMTEIPEPSKDITPTVVEESVPEADTTNPGEFTETGNTEVTPASSETVPI